jgi:predicted membrane metal-binding protein
MGALEAIIVFLILFWLVGFLFKVGGKLIHILLVIALVVLVMKFLGF